MRKGDGGPRLSRRAFLIRQARSPTRTQAKRAYSPAVTRLLPHDPAIALGLRRRLLAAPFAVLGVFALGALLLPGDFRAPVVAGAAFLLLPMMLNGFLRRNAVREPVPGFRSVARASIKGSMLAVSSVLVASILACLFLIVLLLFFADEASLGESALSVTAFGLPAGAMLGLLPQITFPTALAAAIGSAMYYALAAIDYQRRLRRSMERARAGRTS